MQWVLFSCVANKSQQKPFEMLQCAPNNEQATRRTIQRTADFNWDLVYFCIVWSTLLYARVQNRVVRLAFGERTPIDLKTMGYLILFLLRSSGWSLKNARRNKSQQHPKEFRVCVCCTRMQIHTSMCIDVPKDYYYDYYGYRWLKQCARSHNALVCRNRIQIRVYSVYDAFTKILNKTIGQTFHSDQQLGLIQPKSWLFSQSEQHRDARTQKQNWVVFISLSPPMHLPLF